MTTIAATGEDRLALKLSLREWLLVALLVSAMVVVVPRIPVRPRVPIIERDYRIPFALTARYERKRSTTSAGSASVRFSSRSTSTTAAAPLCLAVSSFSL